MAIETTRVIENNGIIYPYVKFQLAISYKDMPSGLASELEGVISLRLIPYRILESGLDETWEDGAYSTVIDNVYTEASFDNALLHSMGLVLTGIQEFIQAKGL